MQQSIEQRYAIKFCVRLGKLGASTLEMIQQAYGRESLSQAEVFRWHKMFKESRENVEDEPLAGRPSTSRTAENERERHLLNTDRRLRVHTIAEQLGIDKMVVHKIIREDLGMRKISAKLVPKVLTDVQKQNREAVSKDLLERIEEDPHFFGNVITGDENWFFQYDSETKQFPLGICAQRTDSQWCILRGSAKRLKRRFNRVRPEISAYWKFHHDNAPSRTCFVVTENFRKNGIATIPQPPYIPDFAPTGFFLFPKVKTALKERHHGTLDDVKTACTHALKDVSVGDFQGVYETWKRHLQKCVHAQGAYFEDY
ncbi:protein GVQW3 [Trichonephila clavipes]|uniref:Protein GVQW3 n=1 Tax=Trichonephila clavipes TaxID=2585209 RepID=A0A8X6RT07_TRICX|nr:protein GVQW3 [Trichonephila clavipes]